MANLVTHIEGQGGDEDIILARWENVASGRIEFNCRCNVKVESAISVIGGATTARGSLHGARVRAATHDNGANAGFVVHHLYEEGAGGSAEAIGELRGLG